MTEHHPPTTAPERPEAEPSNLPAWLLRVASTPDWEHLWAVPRDWAALLAAARADDALWRDHYESILDAWVEFTHSLTPRMLADVGAVSWDRLSSEYLLVLWQQGMIAEAALRDLHEPGEPPAVLLRRFYGLLVTCGVRMHVDGHATNALEYPVNLAAGHFARPYVLKEILRRGTEHPPGFAAAVVRVSAAVRAKSDGRADLETEISAIADLAGRARSHLPSAVKEKLFEAVPMLEVQGQVPITVEKITASKLGKRLGLEDPLRMLSAALSGDLDFAPKAIARGVQSDARHQRTGAFRDYQSFDEKTDDPAIEFTIIEGVNKRVTRTRLTAPPSPDGASPLDDDDEILRLFLAKHPEYAQGIQFARATVTDDELASLHGITRQTVINRRTRARKAFRTFIGSIAT